MAVFKTEEFDPDVLALAVRGSMLGIWDCDLISGKTIWSLRMKDIIGVPEDFEPAIDYVTENLVHPDDKQFLLDQLQEHFENKTPYSIEYRIIRPDGKVIWCYFTGQAIYDETGKPVRMLGTGYDVTHIKEAEARAEAADRAKSQFLANMSHEIRTPMNGVMGMAELLAATELTPKQQNFANIIVKSGESLLTIINDILDFSKIDAGEMELHPEPFDVEDAIQDVALLVSAKAADRDLELAVRIDPELPRGLIGDAGRLRQVITNLMSNAVKFTKCGHVLVNVSGDTFKKDGQNVVQLSVRVEDTGVGIPADRLETIFDKFTQIDNSATRTHEGTGLGLSICKSLIELMGGEIGAESVEGEGAVFWFKVDLPIDNAVRTRLARPVSIDGGRALIIDDNEVNRAILLEQTESWGFVAKACPDGEEGLALLKAAKTLDQPFDVVILDYHMPKMTGIDVARVIRADPAISQTPIVMLTSVDQATVIDQFKPLNIQSHLIKPAKASLLLEATMAAIQQGDKNEQPAQVLPKETKSGNASVENDAEAPPVKEKVDILIAEDNEVNKIVYEQILKGGNYTHCVAPNGVEAVRLFKLLSPKLVIMDVSMPEMNGLDAAQAIRAYEQESGAEKTPIIGVTAHAMSGDMEKCLDAGMDDYLPKPISPVRLTQKIDQWVERKAA